MSLNLINHKLTKSTIDSKGVTWWTNPAVNVKLSSKGEVVDLNNNKTKSVNKYNKYAIKFSELKDWHTATYNSLFARIVLGEKLGIRTIRLKDSSKGYQPDNCTLIACSATHGKYLKTEIIDPMKKQASKVFCGKANTIEDSTTVGNSKVKTKFYTVYEAKNEHITEDGAVFPTLELAEWHQTKVSKGKGNAQVVLDYNGGYVLAEQIYLQEVVYNKGKPYTNFVDVLKNNNGIVSNVQEEHCKFDKLDSRYGFHSEVCFMSLRKCIPETVSKLQAEKLQETLEQYSNSVECLGNSLTQLESLLKQIN